MNAEALSDRIARWWQRNYVAVYVDPTALVLLIQTVGRRVQLRRCLKAYRWSRTVTLKKKSRNSRNRALSSGRSAKLDHDRRPRSCETEEQIVAPRAADCSRVVSPSSSNCRYVSADGSMGCRSKSVTASSTTGEICCTGLI